MEFKTYFAVEWLCYPHSRPVNLTVMKWGEGWWKMYRNQCNPRHPSSLDFQLDASCCNAFFDPALRLWGRPISSWATLSKSVTMLCCQQRCPHLYRECQEHRKPSVFDWANTTVHTSVKHRRRIHSKARYIYAFCNLASSWEDITFTIFSSIKCQ